MSRDRMLREGNLNVKVRLIGRRGTDVRPYNLPSVYEVVALVVGDFDQSLGDRDIIVESQTGLLKRISELHPSYLGLQYPLLFPYGEDGYTDNIPFAEGKRNQQSNRARKRVSMREFASFQYMKGQLKFLQS